MKKSSALIAAFSLIFLLASVSAVYAQEDKDKKLDPATERKVYDTLQACIAEKDNGKKLTMAKEAIGLYQTSQYAPYFKDQIIQALSLRALRFHLALLQGNPLLSMNRLALSSKRGSSPTPARSMLMRSPS